MKWALTGLSFILFFFATLTSAQTPVDACQDIAPLMCAPGIVKDGTGEAGKEIDAEKMAAELWNKKSPRFRGYLQDFFSDPQNDELREAAIKSFSLSSECEMIEPAVCTQKVNEKVLELIKNLVDGHRSEGDLENLVILISSEPFNELYERIDQDLQVKDDEKQKKYLSQDLLPRLKKEMVEKISAMPLDEDFKKSLLAKVKKIRFEGSDCSSMAPGLIEKFYANASYNPSTNGIAICKGLWGEKTSEFRLSFILAHEMAHSIDPCALSLTQPLAAKSAPYQELLSCLRSEKSVRARSRAEKQDYNICRNDPVLEGFSDWFAADVMAASISKKYPHLTSQDWQRGVSNTLRGFCAVKEDESHPDTLRRINAVVAMSPTVRKKMSCGPSQNYIYCDVNPAQKNSGRSSTGPVNDSQFSQGVR